MLSPKLSFLVLLVPLAAAQRNSQTFAAVPPWTLPLFTSAPAAVLADASRYGAPENADAAVLDYFVYVQINASGGMKETTRMITRVLRLQGVQSTRQVNIGWLGWREDRPRIRARVITNDGKAHVLQDASIKDVSLPAGAADARMQAHLLSAVLPGVDFDSVIELETEQTDRELAYPGGRWGEIRLDARNPIYHFSATFHSDSTATLRVEPRGLVNAMKWTTPAPAGHEITVDVVRLPPAQRQILLPPDVPSLPLITFSNVENWQGVARWLAEAVDRHADTLAKVFGDPANKAVALISKLKAEGQPAKAAAVRAAPATELLPSQPGIEAFNRILVYVPGPQPRWIDPTVDAAPTAPLPITDQGRWALIADTSTTDLVRTPESTAQDNREIDTTEVQLQDGGPAKISAALETYGAFEEAAHAKPAHESEGYPGSVVGDAGGFIDLPGPASVSFQGLAPLLDPHVEEEAGRSLDYYAFPPFSEESRYHVRLPPGFHFGELPAVANISLGPLTLSASEKIESDGTLSMVYGLVSPKSRYTPQEGATIRRDATGKLADKAAFRIAFVNSGEELLAKGHAKEGFELLRQSAGSSLNATLRLADGYLATGSRAEAVKVCQQVIAKDAKNAAAYARLGWVYAHDESGRLYAEGMNAAEAEQAYRKAIELKPDERAYLVRLGTLYTYNCCGIRYGNGARLAEAIDAYTKAGLTALVATHSMNEVAGTLLFADKYDELRQFYLYPEAETADPAIRIAGIAASTGANDARDEVSLLSFPAQTKAEVLAHAEHYLLLARDYTAAADLGASDPRLRRAKRFDNGAISAEPAIATVQRFIEAVLNPAAPDEWKKLVAPDAAATPVAEYRSRLLKLFNSSGKAPDSVEWPYIADVLTSAIDFKVHGAGETYSVLAGSKTIARLVKRGDQYSITDLVP